jgi:uracil-DNA glycosylase family 4
MTQRVEPTGPLRLCKIAFVGEAPGAEEAKQGIPFIGSSGQLLTRLMADAGINRQSVYITNVVKERPPSNDISTFIDIRSSRIVTTDAYVRYRDELKAELSACSANVIVAVGKVALYALTGHLDITKRRGSILESTLLPGRKVIPIIHPAAALRQYEFTHMIAFDLMRIKEQSKFPELKLPQRLYLLRPSFGECIDRLAEAATHEHLAFDIEVIKTAGDFEVSCISFATSTETISIAFVDEHGDIFNPDQEAEIWLAIAKILEADMPRKITQNGVFDAHFLFRKLGIKTKVHHDTMIAMAIANPDFPKGLDFISSIYTLEPYYKDDGKTWFKLGGRYRDLWLYNAKDSAVTLEAFSPLMADLARLNNGTAYDWQVKLIPILIAMQERGIKIKTGDMGNLSAEIAEKLALLQQKLADISPSLLPKSTAKSMTPSSQQLMQYFYTLKKIKPYISRATGSPTVDGDALKRIARKGYPEADIIIEMRALEKMRSTYLEMQLDNDGRFRCSFNPVGTVNSRLSSSKNIFGTGGNAQNLPKSFRKFMVADDGYCCYEVDLSQAENRTVAYIAPEPAMIRAFEAKADVHKLTASLIFGVPIEEVTHDQRQWGKKSNHGLNYDLGYKKFAFMHDISESDAQYIVERYHISYPGVRQYHAWVQAQLRKDRQLTNCFGRTRRFTGRWGDELFKAAYDYIPQSTVATKLNLGLRYIYTNQADFKEVELLNQVHDSIWFQIPLSTPFSRHAEILRLIKAELEAPISWKTSSFSIPADFKMGLNFKDLKEISADDFNDVHRLANSLSNLYNELRTSAPVPYLDGDLDDSGSLAEEMPTEMGSVDILP